MTHAPTGQVTLNVSEELAMNFNLFSVIAASAVSASVALPAGAHSVTGSAKSNPQSYTQQYLEKSANFYAALDHKVQQ